MFTEGKKIADYTVDDFILDNYNPDPAIKAEMAV
jgi:thymidylate synthase